MRNKIGLITFVSNNYGTCLQAYAMRKALEKLVGKNAVVFIRYELKSAIGQRQSVIRRIVAGFSRYSINELLHFKRYKDIIANREKKFAVFKKLIYTETKTYHSVEELKDDNHDFSTVVCGSDMIWSPEYFHYLDAYLLTWCNEPRRVSYAPSFGSTEINVELINKYAEALNKFYRISCREQSGAQLVEKIIGRKVPVVLDPTLLFDQSQWRTWFPLKYQIIPPYILVYCFGGISSSMRRQVETLSRREKMSIRYILSPRLSDTIHENINGDLSYGPEEYVQLFANASFIVVNGYHGLIFSLIFEKPFVLLHRDKQEHWGVHEQRMSDLLQNLGLENRYINPDAIINDKFLTLDYKNAREVIKIERNRSWEYLNEALQ